ncbi:helix-turn-helix domain-containing protein [Streptomyces sp. CBMA29]|uniref:helix-turn-helix domain-containing protein n=1 Tax=Streptomyces sp. CBMA29 TaxID=1896314 RepID=UPI001661DFAE|nr:helix-turn-helix transcriptional regulator [Streptomyces sp. CBMA29]MBD0739590.1 transcriptional regulator [Streptomyces sp. CBMA29]
MMADMESATPALCRLQLGSELRQLRLAAGLKGAQVVKKLIWSPSKLTRLETGENTSVDTADVMALCEIYGADADKRAVLMSYAAVTKTRRDWWLTPEYRAIMKPGFKAFLDLEAAAEAMQMFQNGFVPGLLQTEGYARDIHQRSDGQFSAEEISRMVTVRIMRQQALSRTDAPPLRHTSVIDEAVIRRSAGRPQVMRDQLAHIVEVVESRPNVKVQVMPFRAGASMGMNGSFAIFQFPDRLNLKPLVHLEHIADTWIKRDEADVKRFANAFSDLQALALGPDESLSMIKEAIKEH